MPLIARATHPWVDPVAVTAGMAGQDWALCLLSNGGPTARWSYVMAEPDTVSQGAPDRFQPLRDMLGAKAGVAATDEGPPFQGGVAGLAAYDQRGDWPELILARYRSLIAFDHHENEVLTIGRGADADAAETARARAAGWLAKARPAGVTDSALAEDFIAEAPAETYRRAVADVVERIGAGELFQANIARAWGGRMRDNATPFDLFVRLTRQSPAPYAAFWNLPGRALVSNSPEAFLTATADGAIEARPIKGTRPRDPDSERDAALGRDLLASEKDRAENLMIVDLMRNDLARVCRAGTIAAPDLFALERYATVQHLVSTVRGHRADGVDTAAILDATFPPGSITGAPKHQAMKVIAGHEAPRGPWCGSLFLAGHDGSLSASVLIRTVTLEQQDGADRWTYRTLAGAGIVADSDPQAELEETDAKIAAIRRALMEFAR
jgi:para-aminobenzoate synthetase component 1